jgi:hypothetical protein
MGAETEEYIGAGPNFKKLFGFRARFFPVALAHPAAQAALGKGEARVESSAPVETSAPSRIVAAP